MMRRFGIRAIIASTGRWQLEALDGERQVLIIRIIDQKSVIDGFLQALGFIALRDQRTSRAWSGTFFNASSLGQSFIVCLDVVDHNAPFAMNIDGSQGLNIAGFRGTQVGFLDDFFQAIHGIVGIGQHILVHLLHGIVVIFNGLLDFVGGIFGVFKTPGFGITSSTLGFMVRFWVMRGGVGRAMMRKGMMRSRVMRSWSIGIRMIRSWMVRGGSIRIRMIRGGAMWHRCVTIWGRGRSVSITMSMDRWVWSGSRGHGDQSGGDDHQFIHGC